MIEDDFFWAEYCQGVAIGDTTIANTYSWQSLPDYSTEQNQAFYSVIDTGSTALMISALYYEDLIVKMMDKAPSVSWSFQDGLVFTPCDGTYPNIYFMFGEKWIEVNPKDYLFSVTEDNSMRIFFIMPVNLPMNILGMPLFVDYYTIHDPETGVIGWAPHTSSLKSTLQTGTIPPQDQVIAVGEAGQPQDQSSMLIAWGLTALVVYVFLDWWGQFTRPQWEETLEPYQFIMLSGLFFAATFLGAIYIVQPLVYSIVHSSMQAEAQASYHKNLVTPKTIDNIVYGVVLGLAAGFIVKKMLFVTKTTSKKTTADIGTLLAQTEKSLEQHEYSNNQIQ